MSLFTNILLCFSLARLIGKSKLELEFGLLDNQTNIKKVFFRAELELFMNSLVH